MAAWRMAFRDGTGGRELWPECLPHKVAVIQYGPLQDVDLSQHPPGEPKNAWRRLSSSQKYSMQMFAYKMQPGHVIYAKQGSMIVGKGIIQSNYQFVQNSPIPQRGNQPWQHQRKVKWDDNFVAVKHKLGDQQIYTVRRLNPVDAQSFESQRARPNALAEEISEQDQYFEGASASIKVNAFERNAKARAACLTQYGTNCHICGFDFATMYGQIGYGYIHVHHLRDLASIGKRYKVDPIADLRPVCPNCHAMLHRKRPALAIDELKKIIRRHRH